MEDQRLQEQETPDVTSRWQEATVQRIREQLDRFAAFEDKGMSKQMLAEQQRLAEQLRELQGLLEVERERERESGLLTIKK